VFLGFHIVLLLRTRHSLQKHYLHMSHLRKIQQNPIQLYKSYVKYVQCVTPVVPRRCAEHRVWGLTMGNGIKCNSYG
jgi:hypothetical protein